MGETRLEAVIIATGPSMIRLVTRAGNRVTLPTNSLNLLGTLVSPAPAPHTCSNCRQAAFFRHTFGPETVWVCEDHLPHGARAYFPGDALGPSGLDVTCPRCESALVTVDLQLVPLANGRATTKWSCDDCHCCWSMLVGRGLGDDGATLAGDLALMIENDPSISEAWLGFVAYRNICRAMGMGDVAHIHGIPLQSKSGLADMLTLVLSVASPEQTMNMIAGEQSPLFGLQFPTLDIGIGSSWKRRSFPPQRETFCTIFSADADHVTFGLIGANTEYLNYYALRAHEAGPPMTLSVPAFLLYWTPNVLLTERPREWTIWQHVETREIVQVTPGTRTQSSNNQVSYFTPDGRREATPIVTFYRLYRELPTPPERHIWHQHGQLFTVERTEKSLTLHPYAAHEGSSRAGVRETTSADFYELYEALVFEDQLVTFHADKVVLRKNARWHLKSDPDHSVTIVDIGRVGSADYVRFTDTDLRVEELTHFLAEFVHIGIELPCRVGETWVGLTEPSRQGVILEVDTTFGRATLRLEDGSEVAISRDTLSSQFRKLDIRSYWEILDSDDGT